MDEEAKHACASLPECTVQVGSQYAHFSGGYEQGYTDIIVAMSQIDVYVDLLRSNVRREKLALGGAFHQIRPLIMFPSLQSFTSDNRNVPLQS